MTIFGLHDSPDSVMEAVQMYPHSRSAACSPDRLLRSPDLQRLHLCNESLSAEGRDGRLFYHPVVLGSFCDFAHPQEATNEPCVVTGFDNL